MRLALLGLWLSSFAALANPSQSYLVSNPALFASTREEALTCLRAEPELARFESYFTALASKPVPGSLETQRAYLAYRKLAKHCRAHEPQAASPRPVRLGQHDENSRLLGSRAELFARYAEFTEHHPELLRFGHALYQEDPSCPGSSTDAKGPPSIATMIPFEQRRLARKLALKKLEDTLVPFGIQAADAVAPARGMGLTTIDDRDTATRDWLVGVMIDPDGLTLDIEGHRYFLPSELIALHELGHVARIMPGEPARKGSSALEDAKVEIGPVLEQIVHTDEVYKLASKLKLGAVVSYPKAVPGNYANPPLGLLANTFRALWRRYGSIEAALMSPEGLEFVRRFYKVSCE